MPTTIYTDPTSLATPAFEFDADLQWDENHEYTTSDRKVEGKGDVSNYIASKPMVATVSGRVTRVQIDAPGLIQQKLVGSRDALVQVADKRGLVLVVSELFTGQMGIVGAQISKATDDGFSFRATLKLKVIEFTTTASAAVPSSKIKKKVTTKGSGNKKGGAGAKRPGTDGEKKKFRGKTALKALVDKGRG